MDTTDDMQVRFECLMQAVKSIPESDSQPGFDNDIVRRAQAFLDFVNGGSQEEAPSAFAKVVQQTPNLDDEIPF